MLLLKKIEEILEPTTLKLLTVMFVRNTSTKNNNIALKAKTYKKMKMHLRTLREDINGEFPGKHWDNYHKIIKIRGLLPGLSS